MELLDRYQPLYVIGRGGMGTIELAVERGEARRVVALKRMLPGVADRRHADMFLREARLATLLHHESVVHAFAYGEQDDELLFAMEYVAGETLAALQTTLAKTGKQLPLSVTTYVLASLCDGLHAAHELRDVSGAPLGVVHRDVSPHNVMLSYEGDVKLLDFGVAKLAFASHLTKTGEVKGNTAYMSPEQAMGEALDRRSDLYNVGAILFELVTGRRMWTGKTDIEFLRQLALAEPAKLADVAPDAPRALHQLHARLVARKARDRPASAQEVAEMLRGIKFEGEAPPRETLARLLGEHYTDAAREKRERLAAALAHRDDDPKSVEPGAVSTPTSAPRPSRAAPWIYALLGAAVASAIVFALARNRPVTAAPRVVTVVTEAPVSSAEITPRETLDPVPADTRAIPITQPTHMRVRPPGARSAVPTPSATTPHPSIDVDPHAI